MVPHNAAMVATSGGDGEVLGVEWRVGERFVRMIVAE